MQHLRRLNSTALCMFFKMSRGMVVLAEYGHYVSLSMTRSHSSAPVSCHNVLSHCPHTKDHHWPKWLAYSGRLPWIYWDSQFCQWWSLLQMWDSTFCQNTAGFSGIYSSCWQSKHIYKGSSLQESGKRHGISYRIVLCIKFHIKSWAVFGCQMISRWSFVEQRTT